MKTSISKGFSMAMLYNQMVMMIDDEISWSNIDLSDD